MLAQYFDPAAGGSERQACQQAEDLVQAGMEVTVLARRACGVREQAIGGVREIRIGTPDSPGPLEGGSLWASVLFGLRAALHILRRGGSYDVLHLQGAGLVALLAVPAARWRGMRTVAKVSGGRSGTEAGSLRERGGLLARLSLKVFRQVDAWIAVSGEIAAGLEADGIRPERIHRIGNAVDVGRFRPLPPGDREPIRQALQWPPGTPVALFSGRLVPSKGLLPFLDAWRGTVKPEGALLVILGDGPERPVLEEAVRRDPSVRLLGRRDDVERVLGASDVFVFPSRREGMPNAVLEAMACGLPVAAFRIGGVQDLVEDGREGLLLSEGDDPGLARAAAALLGDPLRRKVLGEAGRVRALGKGREATAQALVACFSKLRSSQGTGKSL